MEDYNFLFLLAILLILSVPIGFWGYVGYKFLQKTYFPQKVGRITKETFAGSRKQIVTSPDGVLGLLSDLQNTGFGGEGATHYRVQVDASEWDFTDRMNAKQLARILKRRPNERLYVEYIIL